MVINYKNARISAATFVNVQTTQRWKIERYGFHCQKEKALQNNFLRLSGRKALNSSSNHQYASNHESQTNYKKSAIKCPSLRYVRVFSNRNTLKTPTLYKRRWFSNYRYTWSITSSTIYVFRTSNSATTTEYIAGHTDEVIAIKFYFWDTEGIEKMAFSSLLSIRK